MCASIVVWLYNDTFQQQQETENNRYCILRLCGYVCVSGPVHVAESQGDGSEGRG